MRLSIDFKTKLKPAQAFDFIANNFFENHPKWDPRIIEHVKTTDGPIGVGTEGRAVTKFMGKQKSTFKITEFKPNTVFSFINTSGPVYLDRSYKFNPDKNGTKINFVFDMRPGAWYVKPVFPILAAQTKKLVYENIKLLESVLDSQE